KSFDFLMDQYDLKNATIIAYRGLSSYELTERMKKRKTGFIVALRRNMNVIDYGIPMDGNFIYHGRGINSSRTKTEHGYLYLYEDVIMRGEEETNYISSVQEGSRTADQLNDARKRFGKISILSSLLRDPEEIFNLYKDREEVEQAFDAMKNDLENDKTYLQDAIAVRGYFFISFLSLYVYFSILQLLKSHGLHPKISVKEALLELSKIYAITRGARRSLSEVPLKSAKLAETLGIKLYPKILRN
ncbi:transposase, partial [mine drainage metagenome]